MSDPFSSGGFDPRMFEQVPLFRELQKVMSWTGGPVNWDLARQTAEALAGDPGTPQLGGDAEIADAVRVAELWLDDATALPAIEGHARALTPQQWVRLATSPEGLGPYVEPVAKGMGEALTRSLPEEMTSMMGGQAGAAGAMGQAFGAVGAMIYGVQVGTIAGNLANQMIGCYDLAVPTVEPTTVGTVGDTLAHFASDYGFDTTELQYWLALRESTHRRVFAGVPWLRGHVSEHIGRFAKEADFDPSGMMDALGGAGFDPSNPEALQEALEGPDAFHIEPTAAQRRVLDQLQALVAFIEGYADTVVRTAAADRLGALPRIDEVMQRRKAEHGPGERFLQQLIGLDLKPTDLRQGQSFCQAVLDARGQEGLDRAWQRAEHLPGPEELVEPSRWLVRMAAAELE